MQLGLSKIVNLLPAIPKGFVYELSLIVLYLVLNVAVGFTSAVGVVYSLATAGFTFAATFTRG